MLVSIQLFICHLGFGLISNGFINANDAINASAWRTANHLFSRKWKCSRATTARQYADWRADKQII